MKMFAVVDTDYPHVGSMTNYFLTLEEAEASVATREKFTALTGDVPIPGNEYLEIREVERESHPCKTCGAEVTSGDPVAYPYCRTCHYTGIAAEDTHDLSVFEKEFPGARVMIEHTGGGCFWLAFYFNDGSYPFYAATDSGSGVPDDLAEGWGMLCRYDGGEDDEGRLLLDDNYGDGPSFNSDQLIAAIKHDQEAVTA